MCYSKNKDVCISKSQTLPINSLVFQRIDKASLWMTTSTKIYPPSRTLWNVPTRMPVTLWHSNPNMGSRFRKTPFHCLSLPGPHWTLSSCFVSSQGTKYLWASVLCTGLLWPGWSDSTEVRVPWPGLMSSISQCPLSLLGVIFECKDLGTTRCGPQTKQNKKINSLLSKSEHISLHKHFLTSEIKSSLHC